METPGADTSEAKEFMSLVNGHLAPHKIFARGLYNHSPSFVWDVSFFVEAQAISKDVALFIEKDIYPFLQNGTLPLGRAQWMVQEFFKQNGDRSRGDYDFSSDNLAQILANGIDLAKVSMLNI
jgi:isocitrate lyase